MEFISVIFNELLFRPIFNLLVLTYNLVPGHDLGVAIIGVTLLLRFLLYPLSDKALKSQRKLQELQPKIREIQNNHKTKEDQARAVMEFYKANKVSPLSGCLPILIQLPILIALYKVFLEGLNVETMGALYPFIHQPEKLNSVFLGLIDLTKPNQILAILAGVTQFLQAKTAYTPMPSGPSSDFSKSMSQSMTYMMPLFMIFIAWRLPAGLALYWVVTMVFSFIQQVIVYKNGIWPLRRSKV